MKTKNGGARSFWKFCLLVRKNREADVFFEVEREGFNFLSLKGRIGGERGQAVVDVFGEHNGRNLMAASALALAIGLRPQEIWKNLSFCRSHWGRNQVLLHGKTTFAL